MHGNTADPRPHNDSPAVIRERQRALLDAFDETHAHDGDGQPERPGGPDRCLICELPPLHPVHKAPAELVGLKNYWFKRIPERASAALNGLNRQGWRTDAASRCQCGQQFYGVGIRCKTCTERCKHVLIPGYIAQRDGRYAPRQYCGICGIRQAPDAPSSKIIYNICFDDPRDHEPPEPCSRCKSTDGSQLHHWAPVAIFKDAWDWPMSWLCIGCHQLWHKAMRAAGGYRLPENSRAAAELTPGGDA